MEQISPLIEQTNINALTDYYEYNPHLYGLDEIDCAELTANNVTEMLREEMNYFVKTILLEYEDKLRETDTLHIFNSICHHMWDEITAIQKYYFHECDKTRKDILEKMECHEASEHFEDYMNEPTKKATPCDYPDSDGNYSCPYDANGGDDCRNFCGLGVDE